MQLMSLCKHHIVANSTFSWWSAWLNPNFQKIIVAPQVWLTNKNAYEDTKDVIPKDWIRIKEKADIAVIFKNENHQKESKTNFDKYFLPFDKKTYLSKKDIEKLYTQNFDYVFLINNPFVLEKEVNYAIVPYKDKNILYFNYKKDEFNQTKKSNADMISINYSKTSGELKAFINDFINQK